MGPATVPSDSQRSAYSLARIGAFHRVVDVEACLLDELGSSDLK